MKKISVEIPDRDERGVSPVIGVILMVAITVILAAVIASFVLGFGDSVSENVQAGADISETNDGDATVTWISEGNAKNLSVSVSNDAGISGISSDLTSVGETTTITYGGPDATTTITVTVTANGESGGSAVISQEEVTLEN